MITVEGLGGIKATIVAHSRSSVNGKQIITFELEYPRFIHSELMTHRQFSRNAASSRAIPVKKLIEMVRNGMAMPIHWGKNQPGMQAKVEVTGWRRKIGVFVWGMAARTASVIATAMDRLGFHKQIVNRLLEPFQFMKTVVTATEWDNWFYLRNHADAQPEIKELARVMLEAYKQSVAETLDPGDYHTPYVRHMRNYERKLEYFVQIEKFEKGCITDIDDNTYWKQLSLENALRVSSSCCAQASYRLLDNSVEKAIKIYTQLVESKPVHASPFEHQATPMELPELDDMQLAAEGFEHRDEGTTHLDVNGQFWSGNFCGWIQHRQLIPENVCYIYEELY